MGNQRKRNRETAEGTDEPPENQSASADEQPEEQQLPSRGAVEEQPDGGQDRPAPTHELIKDPEHGWAFLSETKEFLEEPEKHKYDEFLNLAINYMQGDEGIAVACFTCRVNKLFKGHNDVLEHINHIFQPKLKMIITDDTSKTKDLAPVFRDKVKERSYPSYTTLIQILYLGQEGVLSLDEVDKEIEWLFENECDLLEEYEYFRLAERPTRVVESAPHPRHQVVLLLPSERKQRSERIRVMCVAILKSKRGKGKLPISEGEADDSNGRRSLSSSDRVVEPSEFGGRREEKVSSKDLELRDAELRDAELRISLLNLSECEQCTPSYCLLPEWYPREVSECRTEHEKSVLNDDWVLWASGGEHFKHRTLNKYELVLFNCEDDQHDCDVYVNLMVATATHIMEYLTLLEGRNSEEVPPVDEFLTALDKRSIKMLYDSHGEQFLEFVRERPAKALPIILSRVLQKEEEWKDARERMQSVWSQAYKKYLHRSLDHQSVADLSARYKRSMRGKAVMDAAVSECPRETDEEIAPENSAKIEETGPGPEADAEAEAGPEPDLEPAVDKMQCN